MGLRLVTFGRINSHRNTPGRALASRGKKIRRDRLLGENSSAIMLHPRGALGSSQPCQSTVEEEVPAMLATVLAAILGALATAVFTPLGEETRAFFTGKYGLNKELLGRWICTWKVDGGNKETIDHVEIVK